MKTAHGGETLLKKRPPKKESNRRIDQGNWDNHTHPTEKIRLTPGGKVKGTKRGKRGGPYCQVWMGPILGGPQRRNGFTRVMEGARGKREKKTSVRNKAWTAKRGNLH